MQCSSQHGCAVVALFHAVKRGFTRGGLQVLPRLNEPCMSDPTFPSCRAPSATGPHHTVDHQPTPRSRPWLCIRYQELACTGVSDSVAISSSVTPSVSVASYTSTSIAVAGIRTARVQDPRRKATQDVAVRCARRDVYAEKTHMIPRRRMHSI